MWRKSFKSEKTEKTEKDEVEDDDNDDEVKDEEMGGDNLPSEDESFEANRENPEAAEIREMKHRLENHG